MGAIYPLVLRRILIHKALAGLDLDPIPAEPIYKISIHKALAGLDWDGSTVLAEMQGFQSTRPSRASTDSGQEIPIYYWISIHKALAGLDTKAGIEKLYTKISIHKALAGLDVIDPARTPRAYKISIHKALAGLDHTN